MVKTVKSLPKIPKGKVKTVENSVIRYTEPEPVPDAAKAIFDAYIEEQGKRKTPERYVVMGIVLHVDGHYSADDFFAMMPTKYPISRATVYSTLSLLEEVGLVYAYQVNGKTLYERAFGMEPHHHYICKGCGRMWNLKSAKVTAVASECRTPRFRKLRSALYIYGICDSCNARLYRLKKKIEERKQMSMTREEKRFARIDEELREAAKWINLK